MLPCNMIRSLSNLFRIRISASRSKQPSCALPLSAFPQPQHSKSLPRSSKNIGGIRPKSESQAKLLRRIGGPAARSCNLSGQSKRPIAAQLPSIAIIPHQLRPNPSPCTVCTFTSARQAARPSFRLGPPVNGRSEITSGFRALQL
jgi:hypothetical protein